MEIESKKYYRPSTEADRIRATKWITSHSERYHAYQKDYVEKNRELRNKKAREKYAREHPNFKRITKYRKREDDKVALKEKPKTIVVIKKEAKPIETFTTDPNIIQHVKWLQEHHKNKTT